MCSYRKIAQITLNMQMEDFFKYLDLYPLHWARIKYEKWEIVKYEI